MQRLNKNHSQHYSSAASVISVKCLQGAQRIREDRIHPRQTQCVHLAAAWREIQKYPPLLFLCTETERIPESESLFICNCSPAISVTHEQWCNITDYIYSSTALNYNFEVFPCSATLYLFSISEANIALCTLPYLFDTHHEPQSVHPAAVWQEIHTSSTRWSRFWLKFDAVGIQLSFRHVNCDEKYICSSTTLKYNSEVFVTWVFPFSATVCFH